MKRKIFSKLLMGALLIASVSSFVSCKDYDDDINRLEDQINKAALQSNLDALQQKVDQNATTAAAAAANALKAAQDAAAAATNADATLKSDLEKAIEAVKAAAATNADNIKAATDAVAALNSAIEQAKAAAETAAKQAQDAANNAQSAADKAQATADAAATKAALDEAVKALNEAIAAAKTAAEEAAKKAQETADKAQSAAEKAQATADAAATKEYADQIKAAAEAAQKAADEAKAAAEAAKYDDTALVAQLAAAKDAATKAASDLAAAEKALGDRIAAIEANYATKQYVADAIKNAQSADQVQAAIQAALAEYGQAVAENAVGQYISNEVTELKSELATAMGVADFSKIEGQFAALSASVDAWYTAISHIALFENAGWTQEWATFDNDLRFTVATERGTKFGQAGVKTDKEYTFVRNNKVTYEDSILVRVSPVNATLNPKTISLVNTLGGNVGDMIQVAKVYKYNKLITRAADESGLWVVKFKLKENYDVADYDKIARPMLADGSGYDYTKHIVYALAVNNTSEDPEDKRYAVSEFNLELNIANAAHAATFTVNDIDISNLHNRYAFSEMNIATNKQEWNWIYGAGVNSPATAEEIAVAPSTATAATGYNVANRGKFGTADNRQTQPFLQAKAGTDIKIKFPVNIPIKGFYVELDYRNCVESEPSETAAWSAYEYEGVGKHDVAGNIVPAKMFDGNEGTIKIVSASAEGDYIGFRVFAVNLDGTLYDPDGQAFYVYVGETAVAGGDWSATITPTADDGSAIVDAQGPAAGQIKSGMTWELLWDEGNPEIATSTFAANTWYAPVKDRKIAAEYVSGTATGTTDATNFEPTDFFNIAYYQNNTARGTNETPTSVSGINKVKVNIIAGKAKQLQDNKTYKLKLVGSQVVGSVNTILQVIKITVTKNVPNALPANFRLRTGQSSDINVLMAPSVAGVINWNQFTAANKGNASTGIDIRPFDFADIYAGLTVNDAYVNYLGVVPGAVASIDDLNYSFTIKNSWWGIAPGATTAANHPLASNHPDNISVAAATSRYSIPEMQARYVGDNVAKNVDVAFTYRGISLTKGVTGNANAVVRGNTTSANGDLKVTQADVFKLTYVCPINLSLIKRIPADATRAQFASAMGWKNVVIPTTGAGAGTFTAAQNGAGTAVTAPETVYQNYLRAFTRTVTYGNNGAFDLNNILGYQTLTNTEIFKARLTSAGTAAGVNATTSYVQTLGEMIANNIVKIDGAIDVLTGDNYSIKNEYFTAALAGTNIALTRKVSEVEPHFVSDVPTRLSFTIRDAFNHSQKINIDITMLKPAAVRQR